MYVDDSVTGKNDNKQAYNLYLKSKDILKEKRFLSPQVCNQCSLSIYDSLGFIFPVDIRFKMLFQKLFEKGH